jgi:hypothetical protein
MLIVSSLLRKIARVLQNHILNFENYYRLRSLQSSLEFVEKNFRSHPVHDREDLLAMLPAPGKDDVILEFGVYKGESINLLARRYPDKTIYGFDSFEGLPGNWSFFARQGHFNMSGRLPRVMENVVLRKGWFKDTLPEWVRAHDQNAGGGVYFCCMLIAISTLPPKKSLIVLAAGLSEAISCLMNILLIRVGNTMNTAPSASWLRNWRTNAW